MEQKEYPVWYDGKQINESLFCQAFLEARPMRCIGQSLFSADGRITDENRLKKEILDSIEPYISSGLAKKAASLLDAIKMKSYSEPPPLQMDRIHVANGTYFLDGTMTEEKEFCMNRLPVAYNRNTAAPQHWFQFLDELLYPDDVPTLQEYMGYCLLPTTKAQKMLFLIGKGGEGKSRIGLVMRRLLGDNMNTGSIQKVETNAFARADLEHLLLMLDDDMKLEALPQTNHIKSIVTAELPMDLERKGQQSYQGTLYARFMVFGNGTMKSLYDRSEGFFRRQLILTVKDRPKDRVDDPYLGEKLCEEAEGILIWAIIGLKRLIRNQFRFTTSERSRENMEEAIRDANNVVGFMESEGYFRFKSDGQISSKDFYSRYLDWCEDNAFHPISSRSFGNYLSQHAAEYHLEHNNNVKGQDGKRVWGYWGIEPAN